MVRNEKKEMNQSGVHGYILTGYDKQLNEEHLDMIFAVTQFSSQFLLMLMN